MDSSGYKFRLIFILLAAFGASVFFWFTIYRLVSNSRAAGEVAKLSFSPNAGALESGKRQSTDLLIAVPAGKGIAGVDLHLTASNAKIVNIANAKAVDKDTQYTEISTQVASDGKSASKTTVAVEPDDRLAQSVSVKIEFECATTGKSTIAVNKSKTEVVGNISGNVYELNIASEAVFDCTAGQGGGGGSSGRPTINAKLLPAEKTARVGDEFSYDLVIDGAKDGKAISAFDVKLKFDPSLLEVSKLGELIAGKTITTQSMFGLQSSPSSGALDPSCSTDADCKAKGFCADLTGTVCLPCISGSCGGVVIKPTTPAGGISPTTPPPDATDLTPTQNPAPTKPDPVPTDIISDDDSLPEPTPGDSGGGSDTTCTKLIKTFNNQTGEIQFAYACLMPQNQLPKSARFTITFKAKEAGSGLFKVDKSKVTGNIVGDSYFVNRYDAKYSITGSGTPPPSGDIVEMSINLKLKYQGIQQKPKSDTNTMNVKCMLKHAGQQNPITGSGSFTVDDEGVWSGKISVRAAEGGGYSILCKGPKHIQKKICDIRPKETFPGTYTCDKGKIALKEGTNEFDFSGIYQLVGDLPDQDGIVNAYDTSLCRNLLDSDDATSLKAADLNLDGAVNAIDCSLVTAALSIKQDEQ